MIKYYCDKCGKERKIIKFTFRHQDLIRTYKTSNRYIVHTGHKHYCSQCLKDILKVLSI